MKMGEIKEEVTNKRPSPLSKWVRDNLGKEFVISDVDWIVKNRKTGKIMIIEEKTVPSFKNIFSITLGQAYLFRDILSHIKEFNEIPIFIVFIEGKNSCDIKKGVYICKFEDNFLSDCKHVQLNGYWHLDVTKKCQKITEKELIDFYEKIRLDHILEHELNKISPKKELNLQDVYG